MHHIYNICKKVQYLFVLLFAFVFIILLSGNKAYAAKSIDHYTYTNIKNNLPKSYVKDEFLFESDDIAYIAFATYNDNDYKTSVKKTNGEKDYLYCLDYSKHIDFDKKYTSKDNLFNNKLRARLAIAFYHGASKWKGLADSKYTTNNTILDYYMTQIVVHALIYKYGGKKSNYGIDFSKISFKKNTGNLKKKTKAFYKFCCNATIYSGTADFKKFTFSFKKPSSTYMYVDNNMLTTPVIECSTDSNNSSVNKYTRSISSVEAPDSKFTIKETSAKYDSNCQITLPLSEADKLSPGLYSVKLSESVEFKRYLSQAWQSNDSEHASQEVGGLLTKKQNAEDDISFSFLIGNMVLKKTDSVTGEIIPDARFQLQQFDDKTGEYIFYKYLKYNDKSKLYESGNIYVMPNNKNNKFRVIEEQAGANYINDWAGTTFQLSKSNYYFEIEAENSPILGRLSIKKVGENINFSDSKFKKTDNVPLSNIKFGLYAKENIFIDGNIAYRKDQKIVDLITDSSGMINVDDLVSGEYYFKEEECNPLYDIVTEPHSFTIKRNSEGKYNTESFELLNKLKSCQIKVLKEYYDKNEEKHPLKGVRFGLYARENINNVLGKPIIAKDSLIKEAVSDADGTILFGDLPYGDYYIKELEAPKGYILNDGIVEINKEDLKYNDKIHQFFCQKEVINLMQKFKLRINKTGETFSNYTVEASEQGEYVQYQLAPVSLSNVEFSLFNKEDDSFIAKAATNEEGIVEYDNIMTGNYYVMETAAPEEYQIHSDKIYFDCGIDSDKYNPLAPPTLEASVNNELCKCKLTISKTGEQVRRGEHGLEYTQVPLEGVIFGIYQNFEYTFPSGEKLPKDSCVGYIVTDQAGNGSLESKLPIGNYYIKEIKTNAGYDLDANSYFFEVKANRNQNIDIQTDNNNQFVNQLSKAAVQIIKTDANTGKKLKNVEFTLYNNKDQAIGTYKTNSKGSITVKDLPYGKYYFIETKCRDGYYSSNDKYHFELNSPDKVILNITNSPVLQLGFDEYYKEGMILCILLIAGFIIILKSGHGKNLLNIKKGKIK